MKIKMKVNIQFHKESTRDVVNELYDMLVIDVGMNSYEANKYIEKVFYAIALDDEFVD